MRALILVNGAKLQARFSHSKISRGVKQLKTELSCRRTFQVYVILNGSTYVSPIEKPKRRNLVGPFI